MDVTIGEVSRRAGVTVRTLRYYEELGLLSPERNGSGQRRYDSALLDRLYRVRLLGELGTPLADIEPDTDDLLGLTQRHLETVDRRLTELARLRERVRTVEARPLGGGAPTDEELLAVLAGMPTDVPGPTRRLTLLVYRDLPAAQRHLVDVFGLRTGALTYDESGTAVHGEVYAGDGVVQLHQESAEFRLASPATLGGASHCMAVHVDDVDAHHARVRDAGGAIVYAPTDMPYGVREYAVRDSEDGLWSFMQTLTDDDQETTDE